VVQPQVASLAGLAPSNTTCPVSGADINPDRVILYKGKLIAFCCEKCAAEFWLNPEKFADKVK
jgi:YHS domain-containing protein